MDDMYGPEDMTDKVLNIDTSVDENQLKSKEPEDNREPETGIFKKEEGEEQSSEEVDSSGITEQVIRNTINSLFTKRESTTDPLDNIQATESKYDRVVREINNIKRKAQQVFDKKAAEKKSENVETNIQNSRLINKATKLNLKKKEIYKDLIESKNSFNTTKELVALNKFHEENTLNFYRKSLEIQYKSFHIQKELLTTFKLFQIDTRNQLASVIKNVSLPDYKKAKQSELYEFEWASNIRKRVINNFMSDSSLYEMIEAAGKKWRTNSYLREYRSKAKNLLDKTWLGKRDLVQGLANDQVREEESVAKLEKQVRDPSYTGNRLLDNAVIKVIPGYLSKILKQVTTIATGRKDVEELVYNQNTETFETRSRNNIIYNRSFDRVFKTNAKNFDNSLNRIFNHYKPTDDKAKNAELLAKYSDDDREKIKTALLTQLYKEKDINNIASSEQLTTEEGIDKLYKTLKDSGLSKDFIDSKYIPFMSSIRNEKNNDAINREFEALKTNFKTDYEHFINTTYTIPGMSFLKDSNLVKLNKDDELILNQDELDKRVFEMYKSGKYKDEKQDPLNILKDNVPQQAELVVPKPETPKQENVSVEAVKPADVKPSPAPTVSPEPKKEETPAKENVKDTTEPKTSNAPRSNVSSANTIHNSAGSILQEIKNNKTVNIYMENKVDGNIVKNATSNITGSITGLFSSVADNINEKVSGIDFSSIMKFTPFGMFKKKEEDPNQQDKQETKENVNKSLIPDSILTSATKAKDFFGGIYKDIKDKANSVIEEQNKNESSYLNRLKSFIPESVTQKTTEAKEYIDKNVIEKLAENIKSNTDKEKVSDLTLEDIKQLLSANLTTVKDAVQNKASNVSEHMSSKLDDTTKNEINKNATSIKDSFTSIKEAISNRWNGKDKEKDNAKNILDEIIPLAKTSGVAVASIIPLLVGAGIVSGKEAYDYVKDKSNNIIEEQNKNESSYLNRLKGALPFGKGKDGESKGFNFMDAINDLKTKATTTYDNVIKKKDENVKANADNKQPGMGVFTSLTSAVKTVGDVLERNNITMENMKTIADNAIKSISDKTDELLKKNEEKKESNSLLEQIRDAIKGGQKKEEEPRAGNWRDRLAAFANKPKEEPKKTESKSKDKDKGSSSGLLGLLSGLFGKMGGLGSGILGALGLAGSAAMGAGKIIGGAMKGAGAIGKAGYNVLRHGIPAAWNLTKGIYNVSKGPAKFLGTVGAKTASTFGSIFTTGANATAAVLQKGPIGAIKDKIISIGNSLKTQIVKKLGSTAGGRLVATLGGKLAARAVPVAGAALLAYDAYNIYQDMQNGMELKNAVSKNLLGFDVFGDDLPVDENGNPIKPDENIDKKDIEKEKTAVAEKLGEYSKKANAEYIKLSGDIESYKIGFITKNKLPDAKTCRTRIDDEIINLTKLKEQDKIAEAEFTACMGIYDKCYKLIEELEVIHTTGGLTKEEKKENFNNLNIKPIEHTIDRDDVTKEFNKYQQEKENAGLGLKSASEDLKGIQKQRVNRNNFTVTNTTSNDLSTKITNNIDKNKTSNNAMVTPVTASYTPVNNVTTTKPNVPKTTNTGINKLSASKQEVVKIIDEVGKQIGTDPEIMKTIAASESGFDPKAKASTSSASGLFQITNDTWKGLVKQHGSKYGITNDDDHFDPVKNSILGGMYIKTNINALSKVKPDVNATDAYMGHFLGTGGARTFLRNMAADPNKKFSETVSENVVKANKYIAYEKGDPSKPRSLKEVYEFMGNKIKNNANSYGFNVSDEMVGLNSVGSTPSTGSSESNTPVAQNTSPTTSVTPPPVTNDNISTLEPNVPKVTKVSQPGSVGNNIPTESIPKSISSYDYSTTKENKSTLSNTMNDKSKEKTIASVGIEPVSKTLGNTTNNNTMVKTPNQPNGFDFTNITPKMKSSGTLSSNVDATILPSIDKTLIDTLAVNRNMDSTLTKILEANIELINAVKNIRIEIPEQQQSKQPQPMYTQNTTAKPANNYTSSSLPNPVMSIKRLSM